MGNKNSGRKKGEPKVQQCVMMTPACRSRLVELARVRNTTLASVVESLVDAGYEAMASSEYEALTAPGAP